MATYEYTCARDHQVIIERSIHDNVGELVCPEPGCFEVLKRVWNATPAIFKGPGFSVNRR